MSTSRATSHPAGSITRVPLTDRDRELLDFERQWYRYAGMKEAAIRDRFDLSGTQYWAKINALIDDPAALAYAPVVVNRLRRIREQRRRGTRRGSGVNVR